MTNPSTSAPNPKPQEAPLNILIIEDDPSDHGLIVATLRLVKLPGGIAPGMNWATCLAEGIIKARAHHPDLILLDLSLPDSAELGAVAVLMATLPDIPFIVLTGHDDDDMAMAALAVGAQDYLVKGQYDAQSLGRAIRHALARNRLEARMSLFQAALDSAAEAIIITDVSGVIQWGNPAFEKLTGYTLPEVIGRTPAELIKSGEHDQTFYQQMWETILAGKEWRGEIVNRDKNGRLYDQTLALAPVLAGDGSIRNFVAIMHDITDRKRLTLEGADLLRRIETLIQRAGRLDDNFVDNANTGKATASDTSRISGKISTRQREVLELVAQGLTSAEIAELLHISPATVVTHRRDLMQRLDLHSVAELTRYAFEHQLIGGQKGR